MNVNDRNCATADSASIATYPDGGTCFVTFQWDDGAERTLPYGSTEEALSSLRSMGYGEAA